MGHERRRSHPHTLTSGDLRADDLGDLLRRVLRWARANHEDPEIHGCSACLVDVKIYEDKARQFGVDVQADTNTTTEGMG